MSHLNKSLAHFNKNPFHQVFSHRDDDYKLALVLINICYNQLKEMT